MSQSYNFDSKPTAQEAIKRLSSGFSLSESSSNVNISTAKDDKSLKIATFSLQGYLKEKEFAAEFLERGGLGSLCDIIKNSTGNTLAYALNSFLSLMEHDTGWESLEDDFIIHIAHVVVIEQLATIARPAIAILVKLVCATSDSVSSIRCYGYPTIHKAIEAEPTFITTLVDRLLSPEYMLSITSMSLLIVILKYVTDEYRSQLSSMYEHSNLQKNILRLMNHHPSTELKLMILEYQTVFMQNLNKRYNSAVSINNPHHVKMLNDIWEIAKLEQVDIPGAKKWKKIGFTSEVPHREFRRIGLFGLEGMHYFVINNQDLYSKLILEQTHRPEGKRCPFAKASIEVTDLLLSHWNITATSINTTKSEFQPLILNFNHVHSTTLQTFFRIFHDMEATTFDFSKVSALVRSQLRSTLNDSLTSKNIIEFDRIMFETPYQQIRDRRLKELEWADDLLGRDAISHLRTRLSRQSYEFLKKQRISCLLEGAWFPCPVSQQRMSVIPSNSNNNNNSLHLVSTITNATTTTSAATTTVTTTTTPLNNNPSLSSSLLTNNMSTTTGNKRWRYYKLSQSKKALMYGDFSEKIAPILKSYEKLPNRIDLSSIVEIQTIHTKSSMNHHSATSQAFSNSNNMMLDSSLSSAPYASKLSFALYTDHNIPLAEFYCATTTQAAEWKDGFSMLLLDKRFTCKETAELFHTLTEVGVKVKLLQIAGDRVEVPHGVIEVPPVPSGLGTGFFYDTTFDYTSS
ncbi:ELMO/CED-12 family-domain-containing protein [Cokeromyces recurvatus]|uniref:ELMO/CED-12 family-domain-containing protein n=1 Tax=Cokeromyces recurvatus TaxID=90255 RepID=UPI00222001DD|nr:ELMO/CED-12 family-domain-containing protein [Cokeromyces recurvatus]KAI7902057.1 ELMO/CED-12 family-domain-containing protein [Cokeromyces recurvatus]